MEFGESLRQLLFGQLDVHGLYQLVALGQGQTFVSVLVCFLELLPQVPVCQSWPIVKIAINSNSNSSEMPLSNSNSLEVSLAIAIPIAIVQCQKWSIAIVIQ